MGFNMAVCCLSGLQAQPSTARLTPACGAQTVLVTGPAPARRHPGRRARGARRSAESLRHETRRRLACVLLLPRDRWNRPRTPATAAPHLVTITGFSSSSVTWGTRTASRLSRSSSPARAPTSSGPLVRGSRW